MCAARAAALANVLAHAAQGESASGAADCADADETCGLDQLRVFETAEGCGPASREGPELQRTEEPSAEPGGVSSTSMAELTSGADIVCAFNFSTCCLHTRRDLLQYFRGVVNRLKQRPGAPQPSGSQVHHGGVFAMDLYGGTSSECALKLQRTFGDFEVTAMQNPGLLNLCRPICPLPTHALRPCSVGWECAEASP